SSTLQIKSISNENAETVILEYVPGENDLKNENLSENTTVNAVVPDKDWTYEDYKKYFGYYKMTKNDKEETFDDYRWKIKRQTNENAVQVIFYSYTIDLAEI